MASTTVQVLNTVPPKTGLTVVREFTDWNKQIKKKKTVLIWETWRGAGGGDLIVTWAEKVEGRGRAKSSCPRNNFPCDKTYFKEGNYFDGYGRCKGIYFRWTWPNMNILTYYIVGRVFWCARYSAGVGLPTRCLARVHLPSCLGQSLS